MIEIKKNTDHSYSFIIKNKQGHPLLESVPFESETEATEQVRHFTARVESQTSFERKTDHQGNFLFSLKNDDGRVIGNSQLYRSEAGMENGIKNVRSTLSSI